MPVTLDALAHHPQYARGSPATSTRYVNARSDLGSTRARDRDDGAGAANRAGRRRESSELFGLSSASWRGRPRQINLADTCSVRKQAIHPTIGSALQPAAVSICRARQTFLGDQERVASLAGLCLEEPDLASTLQCAGLSVGSAENRSTLESNLWNHGAPRRSQASKLCARNSDGPARETMQLSVDPQHRVKPVSLWIKHTTKEDNTMNEKTKTKTVGSRHCGCLPGLLALRPRCLIRKALHTASNARTDRRPRRPTAPPVDLQQYSGKDAWVMLAG